MRIDKTLKNIVTKKRKNLLLISILLIAVILRLWKLGSTPPGLTPDEAALGFNAFSILKTGRDEYGTFIPVIFKSFGDHKPGLYVYLTVPSIALLGLDEFSVRLPGALFGVLAVWLIYLISNELTQKNKFEIWDLGIWSAFLLAVSPWHIHFSRGAWEVNVSLTLTLAGIYFLLRSFKNSNNLIISSFLFSLTLLTYQGAKLSTLIVLVSLLIIYRSEFLKMFTIRTRTVLASLAVGFLISVPVVLSLFQGKTGRLEVFSIFSYLRPKEYIENMLSQGSERIGDLNYYFFHSETLNFTRGIAGRWFNHFSGRFLFFEGDYQNSRQSPPYQGMLFLFDLVLIPLGIYYGIRKKNKWFNFSLLWLVLAPLPAVLTRDEVQSVRSFNMVVPLIIISSFGLVYLIKLVKKQKTYLKFLSSSVLVLLILSSLIYYLDAYFVHLSVHHAKDWFYGYKQVVEEITPIQNNYDKIIFQQSYAQPYIYILFFQKYNPIKYQMKDKLTLSGPDVGLVENLDNIEFRPFSWPVSAEPGTLVVGDSVVIPENYSTEEFNLIKEIKYPKSSVVAFRILEAR